MDVDLRERYPSFPEGLTPAEYRVWADFWQAIRDAHPFGMPTAARRLQMPESTVANMRTRLAAKGLLFAPPPGSKKADPAWQALIPQEFIGGALPAPAVPPPVFPEHIAPEAVGHPAGDLLARVHELEAELSALRSANEWLTHSDAQEYRGGTLTLNLSDLHYHDQGHLLETHRSLEAKVLVLLERFQPRRFQCILNGDIIPGRGIYRNQMLESVLPNTEQQVAAGAWRWHEFAQNIEARLGAEVPREYIVLRGNHDASEGEDTCMRFVLAQRALGHAARYVGTEWVVDLADAGGYNVLVEHGYGNSTYHQTSNKQILESYRKIIGYQQRGYVLERSIRRLLHGHSHFLAVGIERAEGVRFDTTGGGHRNDRANIGRNTRPVGWIVYISAPGAHDILTPMEVVPDADALRRDVDDPTLPERNRQEAARCLMAWAAWATDAGLIADVRTQEAAPAPATPVGAP